MLTQVQAILGGGNAAVITGSHLSATDSVYFGSNKATIISANTTSLSVVVPAGLAGSTVDVIIKDANNQIATLANGYSYNAKKNIKIIYY